MQRYAQLFYSGLVVLSLSACASNVGGPVDGRADALSPEERRLQALETKLAQMQRRLDALNTTRFDEDNQRLRDEMRALRGDVEKSRYDTQVQDRRSRDLYTDLDRRLQRFEGGAAPAAAPSASAPMASQSAAAPAAAAAVVVSPQVGTPEEEGAYLATFDQLKNGKYDEAIQGFGSMLEKWPTGRYADNAAYWMGEAYYVKRDYNSALGAFQRVLQQYPNSAKVPDAMLKLGLSYNELKQVDQSRATLQQLVQKYPSSNAAKLAGQRLSPPAPKN